ncbi:MAG TPA: SpoIIE family protein phosphatase [Candidatus Polarisedimenticolia bacterium]|jgi:sigma-B regulation protein RsbU (phosphoserine phosphatase)|nr:SpoIIE family protein phosphatase [Candidatus Polarisedimenticolia bacterium]
MSPETAASLRNKLLDRRRRLETAVHANAEPEDLVHLVQQVDAALRRMEGGTYGVCTVCSTSIEEADLLRNPFMQYCLCQLDAHQQQALQNDLDLAQRIQAGLLPDQDVSASGWEAHYRYHPVGPVSGDYCDLLTPDDGRGDLYFAIGDVSGKGVAASLLMAHLSASFRSLIQVGLPLTEILTRQNRLLLESHLPAHYATQVIGRARSDGAVELCNAGHWPPFVARRDTIETLTASGMPIGMVGDRSYQATALRLEPGDTLLLYTDGLIEARDQNDAEYGAARLSEVLAQHRGGAPRALADACLASLTRFLGGGRPTDDLSLMAIRRSG